MCIDCCRYINFDSREDVIIIERATFGHILEIDIVIILCEIAEKWMLQVFFMITQK